MSNIVEARKKIIDRLMRERLSEVVIKQIIEAGIDKITMDKVAEAAGVAKGTLYNYFKNKDELLNFSVTTVFESIYKELDLVCSNDMQVLEKLEATTAVILEYIGRNRKFFNILFDTSRKRLIGSEGPMSMRYKMLHLLAKLFEEGVKEKIFKPLNTEQLAEIFLGMIMSINLSKIKTGSERPIHDDVNAIMSILKGGVLLRQQADRTGKVNNNCTGKL